MPYIHHAADTILWPRLSQVLPDYRDINVELVVDHGFTNIAAERFDAGVRLGESVEKEMPPPELPRIPRRRRSSCVIGSPIRRGSRFTRCAGRRLPRAESCCVPPRAG